MKLILCNGMVRSGSTWLYNCARLMLEQLLPKEALGCGWAANRHEAKPVMLLKSHAISGDIVEISNCVLYSYRDIRDVMASLVRMWNVEVNLDIAGELVSDFGKANELATFSMRYETMMSDPEGTVEKVKEAILQPSVRSQIDNEKVADQLRLPDEPPRGERYDKRTMYHAGHITNGQHMAFHEQLDDELIAAVESKHKDWFLANGYELTTEHA